MGADTPRMHLDRGFGGVEAPFALGADNGNRKRPVLVANREDRAIRVQGGDFKPVLGAREARELGLFGAILRGIARGKSFFGPRTENGRQPRGVVGVRRIDDGVGGSLRGIEALLRERRCGTRKCQRRANGKEPASHCYRLPPPPPCLPPPPPWNPPPPPNPPRPLRMLEKPRSLCMRVMPPL